MDPKQITEWAFRLLLSYGELSKEREFTPETLDLVAQRIQRIRAGLAPEIEFMAAVNWLSNVVVIHRLDQTPMPHYCNTEEVQQPDLLAIVRYEGRLVPVLIEVKTKDDSKLVWREDYLRGLLRYADIVQMPLLVAWKRWHVWALFEVSHFQKKVDAHHVDFNTAMRQTLMGTLFGDALVNVHERFQMFIDAVTDEALPPDDALIPGARFRFTIQDAGFMIDKKKVKVSKELSWIFHLAAAKDEVLRTGEHSIRMEFTPDSNSVFSLSHLWFEVATSGLKEQEPDWEEILRKPLPISIGDVRRELSEGMESGIVSHVAIIAPNTMPNFLTALNLTGGSGG